MGLAVETNGYGISGLHNFNGGKVTATKRGRPPTVNDPTGAKRVKRFRDKAAKDGGKRLDLVLDRESAAAPDACVQANRSVTVAQLVGSLLQREAERLKAG